jgi:pyruvate/2-oxoglutarate dehydrogenase complex dihydrolipoamide acyltransferase (E2) component
MQVPVVMPQLGLTMTEGSVSEWIKKPGDKVKKNEILFIVATDKAEMEVESNDAGILVQVVVEAGKAVPVGTVIAYIETPAHNSPAASASGAAPATSAAPASDGSGAKKTSLTSEADAGAEVGGTGSGLTHTPSVANGREGPPASPRARRLARELGIDIASIKSKGLGARIVEKDVRDAADAQAGSHAIGAVAVSGVASPRRHFIGPNDATIQQR